MKISKQVQSEIASVLSSAGRSDLSIAIAGRIMSTRLFFDKLSSYNEVSRVDVTDSGGGVSATSYNPTVNVESSKIIFKGNDSDIRISDKYIKEISSSGNLIRVETITNGIWFWIDL